MLFHEVRFHPWAAVFAASLIVVCSDLTDASCTIQTARPASSFLCTEAVQFAINSDHAPQQVAWSVTDYYGGARASGVMRSGQSTTTLRVVPTPGVGYYTLALDYEFGAHYEKIFCVLPHPDDARGDGGLFGLGGATTDSELWDALWQIGARHMRSEFSWAEVEKTRGEYRLDWVRQVADLAAERNMQLTVLTGHTPSFYGVRPMDATEQVARRWYLWQPEGTVEWHSYIDAMAGTLMPRRLIPEPVGATDTLPRGSRPLVRAWEVWSEADQSFYYGSWDRYLDMLRIAYCTVRSRGRVPIVYGSCGHMTQLQLTLQAGCGNYFDRVAFHPYYTDPQWMLMHWYRNMPQKLVVQGAMRDTALTECGFHPDDGAHEAGFMPRVYATLKAFGETLFIRSQCLGGVFTTADDPKCLARIVNGELQPRPAYVAFAVTRWMLESAQYVGPLAAPEGAQMELFLRNGSPMVIAWATEGTREVSIEVAPTARVMDALGGVTPLGGPTATVELTTDAVALLDVSFAEFARAAARGLDRTLTTELGHESEFDSGYIDTLEQDLGRCVGSQFADDLRDAVDHACDRALTNPPHGAAAFFGVQRMVGEAMLQVANEAREAGEITRLHGNTIWRLARLTEALGDIADGLGERWPGMNNVSADDLAGTLGAVAQVRSRVAEATGGAECPFADRLLDRALDRLDEVRRRGGHDRGAWWAATLEARVAHSLTAVEPPELRKVFIVGEFSTANMIMKGMLVHPGSDHAVRARVYSFLPHDVSGTVQGAMPESWGGGSPAGSFTAPAGGSSEPVKLTFSVPDQPQPWVQRDLCPIGMTTLKVDAPATLPLNEQVQLLGDVGFRALVPMTYQLYAGSYPSKAAQMASSQSAPTYPSARGGAGQARSGRLGIPIVATNWMMNQPMLPCVIRNE